MALNASSEGLISMSNIIRGWFNRMVTGYPAALVFRQSPPQTYLYKAVRESHNSLLNWSVSPDL